MGSPAEVCNLALSHLGSAKEIQNLDSDRTAEAAACRIFYNRSVKLVQRDFNWPAFKAFATLALIDEDPNTEWKYSYRLPQKCANTVRILSGERTDTETTAIQFIKATDDTGFVIYTDQEDAVLEYTKQVTDQNLWDADFEMAVSYMLAFHIAPRVTAGDPNRLGKRAMDAYQMMIGAAKSRALNEISDDVEPENDYTSSRN